MAPPYRRQRSDAPFTEEQETWLILEYGAVKNITVLRRHFQQHFKITSRKVPRYSAFKRLVERFIATQGTLHPPVLVGSPPLSEETVALVKGFVKGYQRRKESVSLATIASELNLHPSTVWRVVRKVLHWYPYKPHKTVPLTDTHKEGRVQFCDWLLSQPVGFCDKVVWSDEKWFVLLQAPNRYWAPCDPEVEVACKEQGGQKVMAWAGVVQGQVIIHWFPSNVSVNGERYLEMLQRVLQPVLGEDDMWFQQDGAPAHMPARAWLEQAFQGRVISRLTPIPWPSKSPDLSCLDYWFWGVAMQEVRKSKPSTLAELKTTVESFAESLDQEEVVKSARHLRQRARACRHVGGATFEARLKRILRDLDGVEE